MDKKNCNKIVGQACRRWRIDMGFTQAYIARCLGMTKENVCAFEHGRNDSALILTMYILLGFDMLEDPEVWEKLMNC